MATARQYGALEPGMKAAIDLLLREKRNHELVLQHDLDNAGKHDREFVYEHVMKGASICYTVDILLEYLAQLKASAKPEENQFVLFGG